MSFQMRTGNMYIFLYADMFIPSFSLVDWLFVLENYNFGRAIAVWCDNTCQYICVRVGRFDQTRISCLARIYGPGTNFHGKNTYVCQEIQRSVALGYLPVVAQRDYLFWQINIMRREREIETRTTDSRSYSRNGDGFVSLTNNVSVVDIFYPWRISSCFPIAQKALKSIATNL